MPSQPMAIPVMVRHGALEHGALRDAEVEEGQQERQEDAPDAAEYRPEQGTDERVNVRPS